VDSLVVVREQDENDKCMLKFNTQAKQMALAGP
jgi:hypothetical protein